ncbi:MAG: LysR family transcriptional regulator [Oscillatoriales cyanobacterium]|nr:MAG: LysR family transcriptional regulator [Oscillatoriales cyanobacterium]
MDRLEQMRAFTQVVTSGGFAAAARELGVSRSAVSKLVIALENHLGVQLLHRSTRVVSPTEMGLAFYERCVEMLTNWEEAERSVRQFHAEPKGTLRINAPMTFGAMHLAPAIADFMAQYPDLRVQLTLNDRFIDPIEEGFDVTVRIAEPQPTSVLLVQPLGSAARLLCASPAYLSRHGTPTHPQDLRDHSCLYYGHIASSRTVWTLTGADGEHTVAVQGSLCSNNGEALMHGAIRGLGIALLPRFIIDRAIEAGALTIVLPDYRSPDLAIEVLYPVSRHLSTKIRLLVDFLHARFRSM